MPFYNSAAPTSSSKNTINSIVIDYGIRDFLLHKNLLPVYPFLSTSLNGSPKIGEPVLDTMVGTGNITQPFGLPLETEGVLRMEIAIAPNQYKNQASTANSLVSIDDITKLNIFPNSTFPQGTQQYPQGATPEVFQYGIMGKTIESEWRKKATLKNLYLDADKQVDSADWITLETAPITQQIKGYLDVYGGLNLGGSPGVQAASVIGSVLNGQGLGLAKGGVVTNFDLRSSLAGRVLGAAGLINDTKLGMIGGQQLALALANNAAFNVQQQLLGALNVQDNVLSLVKNGTLAGFRPNYQITVPSGTGGKIADYTAKILGFTLPKSYLEDAGSIFLSESNSANIERANSMILNTGKGQVVALIKNVNANLIGTSQFDNPNTTPFRSGYAPGYKDNKGKDALNPVLYAFYNSDKATIYNFVVNTNGVIPEISYNRSGMVTEYGFTGPEDNIGAVNPYYTPVSSNPTLKHSTFMWGSDNGDAVNSQNSPFGGNILEQFVAADRKKSLLSKTQMLFNDKGMRNIVSGFGDIDSSIKATQIQTAVQGGGISKGSAVMTATRFDEDGHYTGELDSPVNTYCRTWTTKLRYDSVTNLIRSAGLSNTVPYRYQITNSTLDQYGFPKIAPYSTDSYEIGDPKNYMFSIENLAWSDSLENLLPCEIGPGDLMTNKRGRIMWFPPYDIKFSEDTSVSWESNNFIGRGESVYTYNNTERSGNLSFSIIVDHPSYINSFRGTNGPDDSYIASFFAGCIDPSSKFAEKLTVSNISDATSSLVGIPQEKVIQPQTPPPSFSIYFPNDVAGITEKYENGLSGSTSADTIDYTVYISGFGLGSYPGRFTSSGPWNDDHNYALNGENNEIIIDNVVYKGISDPSFIPTLDTYLNDKCPDCVVEVTGYASAQGDATANQKLANARRDSTIVALKLQLHTNLFGEDKDARFKPMKSQPLPAGDCIAIPGAPTDTIYCKKDRKAEISFRFDSKLAADKVVKPEPKIKKRTQILNSKITNNLYTECSYFEQLTDSDSFVFDKFRDKIKYFHPAFHSTTPEGLNSRLTFLNQCTRQGRTLEQMGADNLAFGKPPVCILRIGDLFNTKIIIDSLGIDYEPLVWDLNPEGVGVQPMIAKVNMSFKYIGGSTLMGPINKLQNALSFNYYANTQVYDPRADYIAKISPDYMIVNGVKNINKLVNTVNASPIVTDEDPTDTLKEADISTDTVNNPQANNAANPVNTPPIASTETNISRVKIMRIDSIVDGMKIFFEISSPGITEDLNFRATLSLLDGTLRELGVGKILKTTIGDVQDFSFIGVVNGLVDEKSYQVLMKINGAPITSGLYTHLTD